MLRFGESDAMSATKNVLAEGIEIIGTIKFQNDMIIDGKVDGEIQSEKGSVTICLLYTSDAADDS